MLRPSMSPPVGFSRLDARLRQVRDACPQRYSYGDKTATLVCLAFHDALRSLCRHHDLDRLGQSFQS